MAGRCERCGAGVSACDHARPRKCCPDCWHPPTKAQHVALENEVSAWMNGVADFVEEFGFDRHAACGPADLLPGLDRATERLTAMRTIVRRYVHGYRPGTGEFRGQWIALVGDNIPMSTAELDVIEDVA